jgi:hypothetical protein
LAIVVFVIPKVGGARDLAIKIPTLETQEWYLKSMNHTVDVLNETLRKLRGEESSPVSLANLDLDTGRQERLGEYTLADQTYAKLLERITESPQNTISRELKQDILAYYGDSPEGREPVLDELALIQQMKTREEH